MITHPTEEITSFYSFQNETGEPEYCSGTACFVARHLADNIFQISEKSNRKTYCLGKCYQAPSSSSMHGEPKIEVRSGTPVILENAVRGKILSVDEYFKHNGFSALKKALSIGREDVIQAIEDSFLRGRGGAGFPTGKKWRSVYEAHADQKYVVINADEGDPGAYIDKIIMEYDPYRMLEGAMIAGYSVGSNICYIYIRREYPESILSVSRAVDELKTRGMLGKNILGSYFSFDFKIVLGRGSYVCGEETALLRSIEERRPEVSVRPPYPTEKGLYGKPTVINNVETMANVPWIIYNGADRFYELGFSKSRGTKGVSLNSLFNNPGLYEVELGISVDEIVNEIGGGLRSGKIHGVIVGGPLAGIIPPSKFSTRLGYEEMRAIGAELGHGGIIAFDERTSIKDLIENVSSFVAYESCGKCTPCRMGSRVVQRVFSGDEHEKERWSEKDFVNLVAALKETSLCGLGGGLGEFLGSVIENYREDVDTCFM